MSIKSARDRYRWDWRFQRVITSENLMRRSRSNGLCTPTVLGLQPSHGREASRLAATLCQHRDLSVPQVEPASPGAPHPQCELPTLLA